jgi:hypothetical protein
MFTAHSYPAKTIETLQFERNIGNINPWFRMSMASKSQRSAGKPRKTVSFAPQDPEIHIIPASMGTYAYERPLGAPQEQAHIWCSTQMHKAKEGEVRSYDPHSGLPEIEEIPENSWPGKIDKVNPYDPRRTLWRDKP